jgi:hypothetical protein
MKANEDYLKTHYQSIKRRMVLEYKASKEDDLDDACRIIQEAYGIKYGDIAAMFFCGREDDWAEGSSQERIELIRRYIKRELEEVSA